MTVLLLNFFFLLDFLIFFLVFLQSPELFCMDNMNSFVEYSICNRPATGAYSVPKSGYHGHHHHHLHHHHHPLDQNQGFPVTTGSFQTGLAASPAAVNGSRTDSSAPGAVYNADGRLYGTAGDEGAHGATGTSQHHHQHPHHFPEQQHEQNGYSHSHLQTQSLQTGTLSHYNHGSSAYAGQSCARNSEYASTNTIHSHYYMEEPAASTYYHQSSFTSTAPTVGPSYGALAGAYCGPQGALAGSQYPQQLVGGLDAAGYLGLPQGGYGEPQTTQERERGGEEGQQAGQGQTFDWMKVKRNPPKTGMGRQVIILLITGVGRRLVKWCVFACSRSDLWVFCKMAPASSFIIQAVKRNVGPAAR